MKKWNITRYIAAITAVVLTAWIAPTYASSLLQIDGINSTYLQQELIHFNGNYEVVYTGGITGTDNGVSQFFFCFDLNHVIDVPGTYTANPTDPKTVGLPSYLQLASPFNLQVAAAMVNRADIATFGTNTNEWVGLQAAVWSVIYNWTPTNHPAGTLGTVSDPFSISSLNSIALADALTFLSIAEGLLPLDAYKTNYGNWVLMINTLDSPSNVIQTIVTSPPPFTTPPSPPPIPSPEPQTYLMLGTFLALGALGFRRRETNVCADSAL